MPRWRPDAFERLQTAAFELFDDQGFECTTVADITRRAGLTQRTFYNHFSDKREVLFGLGSEFQEDVVYEIGACAEGLPPLDVVVRALQTVDARLFEGRRDAVLRRRRIVGANPELQERELSKGAALAHALDAALCARGVDPETSTLTSGAAMLVQNEAIERWTQPTEVRPLRELLDNALQALRSAVSRDPEAQAPGGSPTRAAL